MTASFHCQFKFKGIKTITWIFKFSPQKAFILTELLLLHSDFADTMTRKVTKKVAAITIKDQL